VVRALHRDDILLARDSAYHLERSFDRLRARIREEERVERRVRHNGEQTFDESKVGLVVPDARLMTHYCSGNTAKQGVGESIPVRVQDGDTALPQLCSLWDDNDLGFCYGLHQMGGGGGEKRPASHTHPNW